ncbi:MAG: sulfatase [Planctomycetes bacterium]|nr:sulfatase [Planctomycetota bacterium]
MLLVSIDTLRADHLGCYGYERDTSPNLDALAARGARFERTFASTSWTLPSHLSMLTGLPVSGHGICDDRLWSRTDADGEPVPVTMHGTFLPEVLRAAGYRTGGFYTWKYLEPRFGFGPGFEVYERWGHTFYSHPEVAPEFERLRAAGDTDGLKALAAKHPALFDATRQSSPETIDRALAWIDEARAETPDAPLFTFVHLFDVHDPYTPPAPYDAKFDPDYDGPIDGKNVTSPDSPVRADMDPRDLAHLVALYDGGIAWVDSEVGRLLAGLETRGLLADTLVMVVSDHGEEFFEHGGKTHRAALYRESVHVPWIVAWPGHVPAGVTIGGSTGLVDLAPTVCGLVGLSGPDGATGRDLAPVLRGRAPLAEETVLSELYLFEGDGPPQRRAALLTGDEHVLLGAQGAAPWQGVRFDLARDAAEREALAAFRLDEPQAADVRARLDAQRAALAAARAATPPRLAGDSAPLSAAELAELAAMGYAGGGEAATSSAPRGPVPLCLDGCCW